MKLLGEEFKLKYPKTDETREVVKNMLSFIDHKPCTDFAICDVCPFSRASASCIPVHIASTKDFETGNHDGLYADERYKDIKKKVFKEYIGNTVFTQEEFDV